MDISFIFDNLISFSGSGLFFILLLVGVLYLGFSMKKSAEKTMLVWFPSFALLIYFFPAWALFDRLRGDGEILYRVLWLIPMGVIICYTLVQVVYLLPKKLRVVAFALAVLLIMGSGKYIYSNAQYTKATNASHVPGEVKEICDKIVVPGREISACFPIEMVQYVRQYTALIMQIYGRDALMLSGYYNVVTEIEPLLDEKIYDSQKIADELRASYTQYFIVSKEKEFTDSFDKYGFELAFETEGYLVYVDETAYLGLDLANHWTYY